MTQVLIIDDDEQIRTVLRRALERERYEVVDAPNGREGIALYQQNPCDVIVTDILMPEMEGFETILTLRKHHPEAKIVVISGGGQCGPQSYLPTAKALGANRIFEKPFDLCELLAAIRELTKPAEG